MLQRLRLTDFKSFVDEQVDLAPLTVLVGANASGKSNFLDAVRFLHGIAFGAPFDEVLNGGEAQKPNAWPGLRGGAAEAARVGQETFRIESRWATLSGIEVCHRINCALKPSPRLIEERLASNEGLVFEVRANGDLEVFPEIPKTVKLQPMKSLCFDLGGYLRKTEPDVSSEFIVALHMVSFLDIQPAQMRGYGRRGAPLGDQGENFSGVLADLCADPEERRALVAWLSELCAPELEDLDFIEVKELGDVMAVLVEKGGQRITARSLSDGTLHFLGTLLALRTAEPGTLLVIEEVGAGLHPTRVRLLVEALETATRERGLQILATTHSPVVLQWLSEETLQNAVVFGRVPEHEGTIMRRLGDLPHLKETLERKGIDELFSTGWLEMARPIPLPRPPGFVRGVVVENSCSRG
jgi:AAA domain, putative AbiEii toxin, Type IV TA system